MRPCAVVVKPLATAFSPKANCTGGSAHLPLMFPFSRFFLCLLKTERHPLTPPPTRARTSMRRSAPSLRVIAEAPSEPDVARGGCGGSCIELWHGGVLRQTNFAAQAWLPAAFNVWSPQPWWLEVWRQLFIAGRRFGYAHPNQCVTKDIVELVTRWVTSCPAGDFRKRVVPTTAATSKAAPSTW